MTTDQLTKWAVANPWPTASATAAALAITALAAWAATRRLTLPPASILTAGLGAAVCTAYSADTSWRFAEHRLGMVDPDERAVMFAAGEIALLACAVMARAHKAATATDGSAGTAGVPGVLVWLVTGVQIIPAFTESGLLGGLVRAFFGPVMAGLLWHLAMGLEIRVDRPDALSTGLPAVIGRELRERLLSRLGLATRDRTAEQITRDRATARAVRLAATLEHRPTGPLATTRRRRLAAAVARSGAGTNGEQRHQLLQQLAARRTSGQLATVAVASPWASTPAPGPGYPGTPLGVTGEYLRRMDPLVAIHQVRSAHPDTTPAELAALLVEYGVPVTETQVRVATRAGNPAPEVPAPGAPALTPVPDRVPSPGLHLDLALHPEVPDMVRHRGPFAVAADRPRPYRIDVMIPNSDEAGVPDDGGPAVPGVPGVPGVPEVERRPDPLIDQVRADHGAPVLASIRTIRRQYGIGQARAQHIRDALAEETTP